jgi:hypothetical protein
MPRGGTLVVVPPHLIGQWKDELSRLAIDLDVLWLHRKNNFDQANSAEHYDAVVVTTSFLTNRNYVSRLNTALFRQLGMSHVIPSSHRTQRMGDMMRMARQCHRLDSRNLELELIRWDRVVVDEFLTAMKSPELEMLMRNLSCRTMWGMAPSVPEDTHLLNRCRGVLHSPVPRDPKPLAFASLPDFVQRCVVRYEPHDWVHRPPASVISHQVRLSDLEMLLSQTTNRWCALVGADTERAQVGNLKLSTPEKAHRDSILMTTNKIACLADRITTLDERVAHHGQHLQCLMQYSDLEGDEDHADSTRREISRIQGIQLRTLRVRDKCAEEHTRWESTHAFLSQGAPECSACPVCFSDYTDRDAESLRVSLVCGHSVCHSCYRAIKVSPTASLACPTCRCSVRNDEVRLVTSMAATLESEQQHKYGSKFLRMLEVLRELFKVGERVVIFTQCADQAKFLEVRLREAETICLAIEGPSHRRCQTLRSFQQTEASALVCMVDDVDGANLQCAAHVFFVDPITPEVEDRCLASVRRLGQERGVQVHRFVTQGAPAETAGQRDGAMGLGS